MTKHAAYRILLAAVVMLSVRSGSAAAAEVAAGNPGGKRGCGYWSPTTLCGEAPSGWRKRLWKGFGASKGRT